MFRRKNKSEGEGKCCIYVEGLNIHSLAREGFFEKARLHKNLKKESAFLGSGTAR